MKILRSVVFTLGLLLAVSAAHAQSATVAAHVPFDFIVGKQVYPAGNYRLSPNGIGDKALVIRNTDESMSGITLTSSCAKLQPAAKTVLVFHRLGNQYFLDQMWVEGSSTGRQFRKSPIETELARNSNDREEVTLAALIVH